MADKTKDAKKDDARMSSIAKTLNKVEDRLEKARIAIPSPKDWRTPPKRANY